MKPNTVQRAIICRDRQAQIREAGQQARQADLELQAGQRRADTEMRAMPEGEMRRGVLPGDVEGIGVTVYSSVAISGIRNGNDCFACVDQAIPKSNVRGGHTREDSGCYKTTVKVHIHPDFGRRSAGSCPRALSNWSSSGTPDFPYRRGTAAYLLRP